MESQTVEDHSTESSVKPVSRFLRFVLASISTLVLGGFILWVMRATGMLVGDADSFLFPFYLWQLVQFAPFVGIAAAAYPHRWLPCRRNALIVAVVGSAVGVLCYYILQERIAWSIHHAATNTFYVQWESTPVFEFQIASCWIATGALAMLVTLTRRTPTVLVSVAALLALAVALPAPLFNFVRHNQELTVAFVVPANPGASVAKRLRIGYSGGGCYPYAGTDAIEAHVLDAVRKAGLPGPYRVAEVARCGTGKKALQIIVLNPPVPADAQLPQPDGTELIYVSTPDGWHTIPSRVPTLGRNVEIQGPKSGDRWIVDYGIHTAAYPEEFGGRVRPD